jgi:DNA-binding GntR family transcriptional regulator
MPRQANTVVGKGLRHRTIAAATAEELRRRILDGEIPAGAQLRQDALATEFGVSRIPVREALLQLEAEGLIKIVPHRGAVVSELSLAEIEELFELRMLLEPWLLKLSAPHLTPEDFRDLHALLAEYSRELHTNRVMRWGELNTRLHQTLHKHAGRPRTQALVVNLLQEADRHTRMQLTYTDGIERAEREHAQIVRHCEEGNIVSACKLLKLHIANVKLSLVGALRRLTR